jgi:hypothetical protein
VYLFRQCVHPILGNDAYLENCLRVKVVGQPGWGMFPLRQNLYKPISNFEQAQVAQKNVMKKSYAEQELAASRPSDDDFRHSLQFIRRAIASQGRGPHPSVPEHSSRWRGRHSLLQATASRRWLLVLLGEGYLRANCIESFSSLAATVIYVQNQSSSVYVFRFRFRLWRLRRDRQSPWRWRSSRSLTLPTLSFSGRVILW